MSATKLASRYAKSLLDLAQERGELEQTLADVRLFQATAKDREFALLLKSPIVNKAKKKQILDALFDDKMGKLTNGYFDLVLAKGREAFLPDICTEFINQYNSIKQIAKLKIKTAVALDEATLSAIKAKLIASNVSSPNLELATEVNPDLIGGFVLEFDHKQYDASVAYQLDELAREFTGNIYKNQIISY
jgi:F-type H+-transporting ATPase subunit delta